MIELRVVKLSDDVILPSYGTEDSACMDLCSNENITLYPKQTYRIKTGLKFEPHPKYCVRVLPRSGLSLSGLSVDVGTVDEDYRGEVGVIITNHTNKAYEVHKGDRIAQIEVLPVNEILITTIKEEELSQTKRGENGFGSTGK